MSRNAFERHGLDHLSASSINLFVAQPAMWAMQKLMGRKTGVGAAAHRGTAVEAGEDCSIHLCGGWVLAVVDVTLVGCVHRSEEVH